MSNGTDVVSCGVCGSAVDATAATCTMCGAEIGATVPTGSRVPEQATNLLRPDPSATAPGASEPPTSRWPGLSAAGLPTRVPRQNLDDEDLREAFAQSWESSSEPTPITRPPFVPTYLTEAPKPRRALWELSEPEPVKPPQPAEPPKPVEPPPPAEPPKPAEPPAPPAPPPGPTPFPNPFPTPTPPAPIPPGPPSPVPPEPVPPIPVPPSPIPPTPTPNPPPSPTPTPPPPVPNPPMAGSPAAGARPPVIVPGKGVTSSPSLYQGGQYGEIDTQSITGFVVGPAVPARSGGSVYAGGGPPVGEPSIEMSGSLTGVILARGMAETRRRERRHRLRSAIWVTVSLLAFMAAILVVADILAGDFIRSIFDTFASFAG